MKLLLVQHGDAVAKEVDPERPLSEGGRHDVQQVGAFLAQTGIRVQRVLHSGKLRAAQTAGILGTTLTEAGSVEAIAGIAPNDAVGVFAKTLAGWSEDTVVVGHLPFMARLTALLLSGDAQRELVRYQPGSVVCLERSAAGGWSLAWMLRPELLRAGTTP